MDRLAWEKQVADRLPLLKLDPKLVVWRLREREAEWLRRTRFRPRRGVSPEISYVQLPQAVGCLVRGDTVQYICALASKEVHLYLRDTFGKRTQEFIQVEGGPEAVLLRLYQMTTRDPPSSWETPSLFLRQAQGVRLR